MTIGGQQRFFFLPMHYWGPVTGERNQLFRSSFAEGRTWSERPF
jgi:hypothetical protein